jgi:uncharacterized protein (TIGR02145 family)
MKNIFTSLALIISGSFFGQISQEINKTIGIESNLIKDIDSIRFNGNQNAIEIILKNGDLESHIISDINNVVFSGQLEGEVASLDCEEAEINGTLIQGTAAVGVSVEINYTLGNGGSHNGQTLSSTGVIGLIAELLAGNFADGAGTLIYTITGTPSSSGAANFAIDIGGESCTLVITVSEADPYDSGTVHCNGTPTAIVDVTNPSTGKVWMDRNLGASQVANSSTDINSYGDLYQWGRRSDGHQCRTSQTTFVLSSANQPAHGNFILSSSAPYDWRQPQNSDLWQGVNGTNNPCPSGYRLPTGTELNTERSSWVSNNNEGAFASPLKLPSAGRRDASNGSLVNVGTHGYIWCSTVGGETSSRYLFFLSSNAILSTPTYRGSGFSVRCIKE